MLAFAFLRRGAVARLSGLAWPRPADGAPGSWIEAAPGSDAVRGCRAADLPYWIDEELWRVELAGSLSEREHLVIAERGRLVARVAAWDDACAAEFVEHCARRAADAAGLDAAGSLGELERAARAAADGPAALVADIVAYARDAGGGGPGAAVAGYIAAHALAGGDRHAPGYAERFAAERARQAAWLSERLAA